MILNEACLIQSKTSSYDSEGIQVATYATLKTIKANIQPASLNRIPAEAYGQFGLDANAKFMYFLYDSAITELMRVTRPNGEVYEIRNVNQWTAPIGAVHCEALLNPVKA